MKYKSLINEIDECLEAIEANTSDSNYRMARSARDLLQDLRNKEESVVLCEVYFEIASEIIGEDRVRELRNKKLKERNNEQIQKVKIQKVKIQRA